MRGRTTRFRLVFEPPKTKQFVVLSTMLVSDDSPQKRLLGLARVILEVEVKPSSWMVLSLKLLLTEGGGTLSVSRVISRWYLKYSSREAIRLEAKRARTARSSS